MKWNPPAKKAVIISLSAFLFWTLLILLKNWYRSSQDSQAETKSRKESVKFTFSQDTGFIPQRWKFHNGDDLNWAAKTLDDSSWKEVLPELNLNDLPEDFFNGICWFRAHLRVDSAHAGNIYGIEFTHNGASAVYWDGKLIYEFGKVSADPQEEEPYYPPVPVWFSAGDTGTHVMAVRYSNHHYMNQYRSVYEEEQAGIRMQFVSHPEVTERSYEILKRFGFALVLLFGFFATLGLIHFLLYLFYRRQKQNLYYSLFACCFSICFFIVYHLVTTTDPAWRLFCNYFFLVPAVLLLLFLVKFLHSLFNPRGAKVTFIISAALAVLVVSVQYLSPGGIWDILLSIYFTFVCIEFIRSIAAGARKKLPGSRIIGAGALIFALFLSLLMILAVITGNVSLSFQDEGVIIMIVLIVFCLVSLPLSMSIYLAYDFSITNRTLSKKLTEVEELSARTIAQEKEKQEILSRQKEMLEEQVKERTREVVEQKKVIEEKNKDITDSINYAKRIQDAILPSEDQIRKMLPGSFVLFRPKDIVSGDFYFFAEAEGRIVAAAVDCTGHGVPGAFMSMVGSNHLKRIVSEQGITDTSGILDELHKRVLHSLNRDITQRDSKDGMDVAVLSIDRQKREVQYSGAVRPLYYFVNGVFHEIKGDRYSIAGVKEIGSAPFTSAVIPLEAGTTFYLFSDGFADQFGGKDGKKLMSKNFRELLASMQGKSMDEQKQYLESFIDEWKGSREQMDDILVIGIKL